MLNRLNDYEHYLTGLFSPIQSRNVVWAIRAFNVETAQIQDLVSEPIIGKMRIEWWRGMIDKTFRGYPIDHPISLLLAESLENTHLTKEFFLKILTAREKIMGQSQFPSMQDLEEYGENTTGSLLRLHLEALNIPDETAQNAITHLGKSLGISFALRSIPFQLEKRRFCLPSDVMAKHSISTEEIFRKGPPDSLPDAVFEIATRANDQLLTARSFAKDILPECNPVLLPAVRIV
jgi:NADH dehydrogenase [ubiquinone] 1 alpha subcomplex assembly factor 6